MAQPIGVRLSATYDDIDTEYFRSMGYNFVPALKSAADVARVALVNELFPAAVKIMAARAGEGFPVSYANHLSVAIREVKIMIYPGMNDIAMTIMFANLGGWEDLMLGAHQNALLNVGMDEDNFRSFRKTTKGLLRKNTLPNQASEDDLYHYPEGNSKAHRTQWWNTAIVEWDFHTNVGANWNWTRPASRTQADAWEAENVPTFEKVASDRVNTAWRPLGVAPEWLILEYGTPVGTVPTVRPQAFRTKMQLMARDAFIKVMTQTVRELERQMAGGARLKRAGTGGLRLAPSSGTSGRYTKYKAASIPDLSSSLALI